MSNFLNQYPLFEDNQVLTSTQLNETVEYLDEQTRLTRTKVIGTGIVCGMDIDYSPVPGPQETAIVALSGGVGITSEGFLIHIGDCVLKKYRPYEMPMGVDYIPFENPSTKLQDVTLYEVITEDAPPLPGDNDITQTFCNDKVVLLFLETVEVDLQSCLGKACDDNGMERVFNLRKLMINKQDMGKIFARTCSQNIPFRDKYELPEITMKRPIFNDNSSNSSDYFAFSGTYVSAIKSAVNPDVGTADIFNQLFSALRQTYEDFEPILSAVYGGVNPFSTFPDPQWKSFLNGNSTGPKFLGVQYFYDFIKDLILAYNEFRDIAFDLMSECCGDEACFPRHLMLGDAIPLNTGEPTRYRHFFISSPIFDGQKERLEKAVFYHKRIVVMLNEFKLSTINSNTNPSVPIFITPSRELSQTLSERSMPYYYDVTTPYPALNISLSHIWNYEFVKKDLFSKSLLPLGFGNLDKDNEDDKGPVKSPLYYDLDSFNFLRIENHLRTVYYDAKTRIETIKKNYDLPFNVIALRLSGNPYDDIKERCNFDDLKTTYGVLRTELLSLVQGVYNRFSKPLPAFIRGLANSFVQTNRPGSVTQPQIGAAQFAPQRNVNEVITLLESNLVQFATALNDVTNQLPFNMTAFRFGYVGQKQELPPGFIQQYFTALEIAINIKVGFNQLLDLIERNTVLKNTADLYGNLLAYWNENVGHLEQFIRDARYKSLTLVIYTLQYRLNVLSNTDMTLFSNFIKKHPGVQHRGGVQPGGTFILVYNGDQLTVDTTRLNNAVDIANMRYELEIRRAKILSKGVVKSMQDQLELAEINSALLSLSSVTAALKNSAPIEAIGIQGDQVVADFCLPYLCCCDCECENIQDPDNIVDLNIPALTPPYYAEYSLGDYAIAQNSDLAAHNTGSIPAWIFIDIIPVLQYGQDYGGTQIRLYLVDKYGQKVAYQPPVQISTGINQVATTQTFNDCNLASNTAIFGTAAIITYASSSTPQKLGYKPVQGFAGTDSFYYLFEIVDGSNNVVRKSTMGKITIHVDKVESSQNPTYGGVSSQLPPTA